MARKYALIVEKDDDGWLVSEVLGLPGCHSQAKTMDELIKRTREAIHSYLKAVKEPQNTQEFIGVQLLEA